MFVSLLLSALSASSAVNLLPEARALSYLVREVPRWSADNKCYSCHNNGDAARALYAGRRLSYPVPETALADTSRWLSRPQRWDDNGGDREFSDRGLARLQFAAALVEAIEAGSITDKPALQRAAALVADQQQPDGSWKMNAEGNIGSPVTYGACLATYQARRILRKADAAHYRKEIARADQWFLKVHVQTVLDAAAVLLALDEAAGEDAAAQRRRCLDIVTKGQSKDGGWGPYITSASEPFDTAVVLLALARQEDRESQAMRRRGRAYLMVTQKEDGSWPETTRPAGGDSYAQRLSTTGWATQALLATRGK